MMSTLPSLTISVPMPLTCARRVSAFRGRDSQHKRTRDVCVNAVEDGAGVCDLRFGSWSLDLRDVVIKASQGDWVSSLTAARGSQCVVKRSEGSREILKLTPRVNACGLAVRARLNTFLISHRERRA